MKHVRLHVLRSSLETDQPFHVISGYRSRVTNNMLRSRSNGVAKQSLHMAGKSVDIRMPGQELTRVREAAFRLRRGGVGLYPKSDFVHLDVGRVRIWQAGAGHYAQSGQSSL